MAVRYLRYRRTLTSRAQALRREPTPAEKKLWFEFLRDLPQRFSRQKPLGRFIADFYCARCGLVIELDGDTHYSDRGVSYDEARTEALARLRLRVIRFTNEDVLRRFEGVCGEISRALKEPRAPRP